MVELLILEVGEADGVCTCTSGASHLHLTTEAKVREEAVVDALRALENRTAQTIIDLAAEMERQRNIADTEAMIVGRCEEMSDGFRCISKRGHFMAHDFFMVHGQEDEPSVPSVSS